MFGISRESSGKKGIVGIERDFGLWGVGQYEKELGDNVLLLIYSKQDISVKSNVLYFNNKTLLIVTLIYMFYHSEA